MKFIKKFNEGFLDSFRSKDSAKKIEVGDKVKVISLEGEPVGRVYDITGNALNPRDTESSYWVDLGKFGKSEFSDFELEVISK